MVLFPTYYALNQVGKYTTWNFKQIRRVEMNKTLLASMLTLGITVLSTTAMGFELGAARQGRGADDAVGHVRQSRGLDDPAGHVRQGRGADDPVGHIRQCRGCDDPVGHISGRDRVRSIGGLGGYNSGRGTVNPVGHVRGGGADNLLGNIRGGRGADDAVAEVRGAHADGHISGRDRVRIGGMGALGLLGR